MTAFDPTFTQKELDLLKQFKTKLDGKGEKHFSSDDFRAFGLDKEFTHPEKEVGMLFAKAVINKLIKSFGEKPSMIESNHGRKNDMFEWTGKPLDFVVVQRNVSNGAIVEAAKPDTSLPEGYCPSVGGVVFTGLSARRCTANPCLVSCPPRIFANSEIWPACEEMKKKVMIQIVGAENR